ncbi:alpha/beta-hydrolase [Lichtheimia hyalospora FSU 10163]|nr:alpha/beta-hydrolase [Lichtheimia hyalospora FSU 10163]
MAQMLSTIGTRTLLLLTTTAMVVAAQTAENYKVTTVPGVDSTIALNFSQYAGHIEITPKSHGNLFFWSIQPDTETDKLIIWLNGGPGCSSMDGLFMGNGPYRVNRDLSINVTSTGWQQHATMVFVDQPVGTGYSLVDTNGYAKSMVEIMDQFVTFIDKLFDIFPEYKEKELYLAGESFAGTYVPYFAYRMLELNRNDEKKYRLQGIAIGNGWISPEHQYDAYVDFAYEKGLVPEEHKPIIDAVYRECKRLIQFSNTIKVDKCEMILQKIVDATVYEQDGSKYCINMYDSRLTSLLDDGCGMAWPVDIADVTTYMRTSELMSAVHVENFKGGWTECGHKVGASLADDKNVPSYNLLPKILEEIPVLMFGGDQDLICNMLGIDYLIGNMTWNGAKGFQDATALDWYIGDTQAGLYKQARNLSLVTVYDGSHMVSYDKPLETLDMMNRFMGVGDNQANGVPSRIVGGTTSPGNSDGSPSRESDWSQYYGMGTLALIFVICFAGVLGYCWYKSRKPAFQGYGPTGAHMDGGEGLGIIGGISGIVQKKRSSKSTKLRLDDGNDTNELDELVIETPGTLFTAEGYSDDDPRHQRTIAGNIIRKKHIAARFAIEDDEDNEMPNNTITPPMRDRYP